MAWEAIDRNVPVVDRDAPPILPEAVRAKIRSFFPRYPTKRAVLLPALHVIQNALGYVPWQAMVEVAELLEIHPSDVIDTISFYTYFWIHPKGEKVITVCRGISCELMGGPAALDELKRRLGIDEHGTTPDGRYSLVTEECIGGCDFAPCMLINEKLHKGVKPERVEAILADPKNDHLNVPRSALFDGPKNGELTSGPPPGGGTSAAPENDAELVGTTSDVREMREAD
jgi:NADH-quinone oxidoreductase subunit E